jgi:hypothetical protein
MVSWCARHAPLSPPLEALVGWTVDEASWQSLWGPAIGWSLLGSMLCLCVLLSCLVAFHGGGTMTSVMQHVIDKPQLYSCFAKGPDLQLFPNQDSYL